MKDKNVFQVNGFIGILSIIALLGIGVWLLISQELFAVAIPLLVVAVLLASGITIVQPNQAAVVTFFGSI